MPTSWSVLFWKILIALKGGVVYLKTNPQNHNPQIHKIQKNNPQIHKTTQTACLQDIPSYRHQNSNWGYNNSLGCVPYCTFNNASPCFPLNLLC